MPPMPWQLCSFECGPDHVLRQGVQVQGLPLQALKNVPPMRIARARSVPFEKKPQLCNDRNGPFALLSLRFIYMASPHCLLYPDGKAIIVFPKETADFTLASARECRYCDCGSGWFGKDAEHLHFLFKRVCMGLTAGPIPGDFAPCH